MPSNERTDLGYYREQAMRSGATYERAEADAPHARRRDLAERAQQNDRIQADITWVIEIDEAGGCCAWLGQNWCMLLYKVVSCCGYTALLGFIGYTLLKGFFEPTEGLYDNDDVTDKIGAMASSTVMNLLGDDVVSE